MKIFVALWSRDTETKLNVDQDTRFAQLQNAVTRAFELYQAAKAGSADYTGPIKSMFVAPEYLFTRQRDPADATAGRAIEADEALSILKKVRNLSRTKEDMLLVPGSIIYKYAPERHEGGGRVGALEVLRQVKAEVDATAPRFKRVKELAPENDPTVPTIQAKVGILEGTGEINHFVKNRIYIYLNGDVVAQYGKKADRFEVTGNVPGVFLPGRQSGRQTIADIKFGFEICYDHEIGVLKAMSAETVDFQVVASAAVTNNTSCMVVRPGGFFLHASSTAAYSTVFFKPTTEWKKTANPLHKNASYADPTQAPEVIETIPPEDVDGDPLKCFVLTYS